ncbi:right-handed parallel beta-helix repeat-containing protein [Streptomyces sp. L2]|uniref:right-handed parallel beta-helix repeat-containing protein n=1 Tax=Streptomyces sp. L2 TaxID=2162665 RepID=UPI0019D6DA69|nr:right-handed parallel beta-helix repeat-containing protein [Streptomyces sp. L2]
MAAALVGVLPSAGTAFASAPSAAPKKVADVRDCGAVGDGTTDDTGAFKCAIAQATAWKVPVYVPWGRYRITDTLTLTQQLMVGHLGGTYTSDYATLPTIVATDPSHSAIRLKDGGAVAGLNFDYPQDESSATPTQYATTILLDGVGTRVSNVRIAHAWKGIESVGQNTGRAVIQDVFISSVAKLGMRLDTGYDTTTISNVEVWTPPGVYKGAFLNSGVGIELDHLDAYHMSGGLVFGAQTGVLLQGSAGGLAWGTIDGLTTDYCVTGVKVADNAHLTLTNTTHRSHVHALEIDGTTSTVNVSGGQFRSNAAAAVYVHGGYIVTVSSSEINAPNPALEIDGGAKVNISGNDISGVTAAAKIDPYNGVILFSNNVVVANTHEGALINHASNPFTRVEGNIIYP